MILGIAELAGRSGREAGRALLEALYFKKNGESLPPIRTAPRGKPCFEGSPWHFSISHTPRHALCVLALEEVGLDAEELDRTVSPRLAEKVLSRSELAQYHTAEDRNKALLTFWVLKEAAAKLTGDGLRGYPNHTSFSLPDERVLEAEGCVLAVLTRSGRVLTPEEIYVI